MAILGLRATERKVIMDKVGLLQENANDCLRIISTYETKQTIIVVLSLQPAKCILSQSLSGLSAAESK